MNKKELENEITKTQEQLKKLQAALDEAEKLEKDVPETLDFNDGDKYWCVDGMGNICWDSCYTFTSLRDNTYIHNHRAFLSEEYAKNFAKKTQFIADMLHFKYLYDRNYEPNWDAKDELKFFVYYNAETKKFNWSFVSVFEEIESVYFSSRQLAERCVEWLNKRMK